MSQGPKVSVVIPTYNEASYVGRLLTALSRQNFKDFEVIVSDASSEDGIEAVIAEHQKQMKITLVQTPPKGPAAGRNAGAKKAGGEWLLFLDADVDIDDRNFLRILLKTTANYGWSTSTALYKVFKASWLERAGADINLSYIKLLAHTKHPVAPGFCIFTKRQLFLKNNGFDEKLYFGEDYDYVTRCAAAGFGFVRGTYYYQDLRRFRQGNQYKVFVRNVLAEIYRHTHGFKIDKPPFKYEFGKHKARGED